MNFNAKIYLLLFVTLSLGSCVSKKQFMLKQTELDAANADIAKLGVELSDKINRLRACEEEQASLRNDAKNAQSNLQLREEQIKDLREQIADIRSQRDKQLTQVDDLTTLSKSASDNIKETLSQLEKKDKYIQLLQAAKTRADSINLALSVNLKGVLSQGIEDKDVEVKVDKTVVFINLSDKMLFQTGSANITPKASDVLGKIAKIIESRPGLEVMVEGYTDNQPISRQCFEDNWDLSTKRATAVVRVLQKNYKVDPNRLIAAGRGEYNTLASNATADGRATNRRTRIIIMPKLDQFYDLLNPELAPK
ncbi:MAG: OmpA family protein [Saprospiraceae bacterium]|nr:OmpA family protein [Saprospiraceae bacterium]